MTSLVQVTLTLYFAGWFCRSLPYLVLTYGWGRAIRKADPILLEAMLKWEAIRHGRSADPPAD